MKDAEEEEKATKGKQSTSIGTVRMSLWPHPRATPTIIIITQKHKPTQKAEGTPSTKKPKGTYLSLLSQCTHRR